MSVISTVPVMKRSWSRWQDKNGVTITEKADMDIDSFKEAVDGVDEWFVKELQKEGYDDAKELVDLFTAESGDTVSVDDLQ